MPNQTQQHMLNDYFGADGDYFSIIKDYQDFNTGIKILYLERAINQDCTTFLKSLDKLYNPLISPEAKTAHLEFIQTLKLINDLCFNNDILLEVYGSKPALDFWFGAVGTTNPAEFKKSIQAIIEQRIGEMNSKEANAQKAQREKDEHYFQRYTTWRQELKLPSSQYAPVVLNGALTVEEYKNLTPDKQQLFNKNPHLTHYLIKIHGLPLDLMPFLTDQDIVNTSFNYAKNTMVVNIGALTAKQYLELPPEIKEIIESNPNFTRKLIHEHGLKLSKISLEELKQLLQCRSSLLEYLTMIEDIANKNFFEKMGCRTTNLRDYSIYRRIIWQSIWQDLDSIMFFDRDLLINLNELIIPFSLSSFQNGLFINLLLLDIFDCIVEPLGILTIIIGKFGIALVSIGFLCHAIIRTALNLILFAVSIATRTFATLYYVGDYFYTACKSNNGIEQIPDESNLAESSEGSFKI